MNQYPFQTLRDLLRYAVTRFQQEQLFFGHGNNNAYDEAAYLLLHGLHLPLDTLEPFLDAILLPDEIMHLLTLINRRIKERIPAAYLTQEAWMHGLRFYVDQRVIVPRSLIGELLQEKLTPWLPDPNAIQDVLELCTGSGCLAIMAALIFPHAQIDAVDISADALQVAQRNRHDYQLEERITLYQGDLYQALENAQQTSNVQTSYSNSGSKVEREDERATTRQYDLRSVVPGNQHSGADHHDPLPLRRFLGADVPAGQYGEEPLSEVENGVSEEANVSEANVKQSARNDKVIRMKRNWNYDLIIANPPYVNQQAMQNLPAEYLAEPHIALAGGVDGMDLVRRIIAQAKNYLSPQGTLIVEIGNEYQHVIHAFPELPFTWLPTSAGEDQVFLLHARDL